MRTDSLVSSVDLAPAYGPTHHPLDTQTRIAVTGALAAAFTAVPRLGWHEGAPEPTMADPEWDALRRIATAFVVRSKSAHVPPEQVLVRLKAALRDSLRMIGHERHEEALRGLVFETFLTAYYA